MESAKEVKLSFGTSRLWSPYRDLQAVINDTIYKKQHDLIPDFEAALKKHKPDFISLLKNPGPNSTSRAAVVGAAHKGLMVAGQTGGPQTLSQAHVDEALLISDMLQLDEIVALELLIAGEHQQRYFPDSLTRGLVAILLYYDGRRTLANCIHMLAQARPGRSWEVAGLHPDLAAILDKYSTTLQEHGLLGNILALIQNFDLAKEIEMLEKNRALGGLRYRKQVVDLIQECYQFLAETVFCWAGQGSLQPNDTLHLLQYVSQGLEVGSDGALQPVSLCLLMALLAALDISPLQGQELPHHLFTLLHSPELLPQLQRKMAELTWQLPGLAAVVHLAWGLALSLLSQCSPSNSDILEGDEAMVDLAIKEDVFYHLKVLVVQCKAFRSEDFFVKQVHELITNFIVLMPHKVKELRANGDEVAKIVLAHYNEGINPPLNLSRHLEHLFNLVTELYREDPLELCQAYWCPLDVTLDHKYQRQVALHKFVRISSDYLPAPLFVPYIDMLASLSNAPSSAHHCYTFLKLNSKNTPDHSTLISWDHIMDSLNHYFSSLRLEVEQRLHRPTMKGITIQEVARLKSVLRLLHVVVSKSESAGLALADHPGYSPLGLLLGLLSCPVPPDLKASIFLALEAFAHLPGLNLNIFTGLEASKLLQNSPAHGSRPLGLFMELEELEARTEEFPMTRGFLTLLNTLVSQPLPPNMSMEPYLVFVCNHVLLRFETRSYTNAAEKWEVARLCLSFLARLVEPGVPDRTVVCYSIMYQLLQGTNILRILLYILHVGCQLLASYTPVPGHQDLEQSLVLCLEVLHSALLQQGDFLQTLRESGMAGGVVTPLEDLLLVCNPETGFADYVPTMLRLAGLGGHTALASLRLLAAMAPRPSMAQHLADISSQKGNQDILYGIMEAMELDEVQDFNTTPEKNWSADQLRTATAQEALRLCLATLDPVPGLAHWLLGFGTPVARTVLQETPRTCLHATLHAAHRPVLAPLAFQLLYRLAAGVKTSAPTLRYLRGSDFFPVHLQRLPFTSLPGSITTEEENLVAQAWFLKTLALEIKLACEGQHKSHLQRLISLLLAKHHSSGNLLVATLSHLERGLAVPSFPTCEYLAEKEVLALIRQCEVPAAGGGILVDEKLLQSQLEAEISPHKHLIAQELENVMNYVKQINQARRYLSARVAAFEAWRQMTEITLGLSPPDVLADETRTFVVLDVAQELLDWLVREEIGELCTRGTGVVVTLLAVVYDRCTAESGTLLCLLHKLIDVLSHFIGGRERVKMHLYAAMLLLLLGPLRGVEALPSPEDKLGDIVCKDACRAFTVTRMLAVSLLDAGVSSPQWLTFLMGRGYLGHLATETCGPPLMNSLCSLFSKVASQGQGARAVLAAGLLPRLPDCSPPCLHLALSLASTLRPGHRQLLSQLCVYLTTQVEALSTALRSPATPPDHLALITSLLAYVSSIDLVESLEQPSQVKLLRQHQTNLLASPEKLEPPVLANILHSLCPSGTKVASQVPKLEVLLQLLSHIQGLIHKAALPEEGAPKDTTLLYYVLEKCTFLICHLLEQWPGQQPREISSLFPESFFTRYNIVDQALKKKETNPFLDTMLRRIKKVVSQKA